MQEGVLWVCMEGSYGSYGLWVLAHSDQALAWTETSCGRTDDDMIRSPAKPCTVSWIWGNCSDLFVGTPPESKVSTRFDAFLKLESEGEVIWPCMGHSFWEKAGPPRSLALVPTVVSRVNFRCFRRKHSPSSCIRTSKSFVAAEEESNHKTCHIPTYSRRATLFCGPRSRFPSIITPQPRNHLPLVCHAHTHEATNRSLPLPCAVVKTVSFTTRA